MPRFRKVKANKAAKIEAQSMMLTGFEKCNHSTAIQVFGNIYAGSGIRNCIPPEESLILDLARYYVPSVIAHGLENPFFFEPTLEISWTDGSVPPLDKIHWEKIARLTEAHTNTFIACAGGHGRTGTALAILGSLRNLIPAEACPVAYTREHYCNQAVETSVQIQYISRITGRAVTSEKSRIPVVTTYTQWKGGASQTDNLPTPYGSKMCNQAFADVTSINAPCGGIHECGKVIAHRANHECDTMGCKVQWANSQLKELTDYGAY